MESVSKKVGANKNVGRKKKKKKKSKSAIVSYNLLGKVCKAIHMITSIVYLTEPPFRLYLVS